MAKLVRGDRVEVWWEDICTDATWQEGDGEHTPEEQKTVGWFVGWRMRKVRGKRCAYLVITDTLDPAGKMHGATAFPKGCVLTVEKV